MTQKYRSRARNLLHLGSTQANENFNQMVSSKAPKARHYGGSSSLMNRVSATVLQKNEGHSYLAKDLESIPDPIKLQNFNDFVTFDLETTGFGYCDITQIAASVGSSKYQSYVYPRCQISVEATKVTGMSHSIATNKLYLHGKEVQGKCIRTALLDFIDFLKEKDQPILVGHNIASFDVPILSRLLKEFGLHREFVRIVPAYIDTLKVARKVFSKEEVNGCYKQCNLVEVYLNIKYDAHVAVEDVNSLQQLFTVKLKDKCTDEDVYSITCKSCKESYTDVIKNKIVSKVICEKLSKDGIALQHLQLANRRDPNGLRVILREHGVPFKKCEDLARKIQEE
ncbi:uncharacterized protein LOC117315239 [Pecten maximus]|uniref:uncharacterized protein LOC117315239 n=1 Tax=Pecten maximus TaxID=6579 RepID=UPI001457F753|nr:uncharacterized protein LOC117315239 [Pecten maximus]